MGEEQLEKALSTCPLLCGCRISPKQVMVKTCRKGQFISDRIRGQETLGLVMKGRVDVYSVALDGREVLLSALAPGECFGVINLLTEHEFPTVLRCRERTTVLLIPKRAAAAAMETDPAFALRYARFCSEKLRFLLKRIELLLMQSGRSKVIQYLLTHQDEEGLVRIEGSKEQLAAALGISRASLFRELSALKKQGLTVQAGRGILKLPNARRLEKMFYEDT